LFGNPNLHVLPRRILELKNCVVASPEICMSYR
jgi:hypothetical protein